jgi:lipooligosaccharide transport system ATP-binding protein
MPLSPPTGESAPASAPLLVHCQNLSKNFNGKPAVAGLDLDIPPRICFGLLGPNGAGKTTTLRMLLGQSPRSGGTLEIFGQDIELNRRQIRQRTGIVPQADNLDPDFTVEENLRMYGSYFRLPAHEMDRRIPQLLDMVELSARAADRIDTLSGGLKRRLTLARALVNDPEFLVLDEPTTGLDPQARHMIWSLLHRMKRNGKTILLTTHYMEEAERLCDQLMIIDNGTLLAQDSPTGLIRKYCESDVLEIRGGIPKEAVGRLPPSCRTEHAGESLYIYSNHAKPLLELAQGLPDTACLHRHSGLEDVFLRLTGRELRG